MLHAEHLNWFVVFNWNSESNFLINLVSLLWWLVLDWEDHFNIVIIFLMTGCYVGDAWCDISFVMKTYLIQYHIAAIIDWKLKLYIGTCLYNVCCLQNINMQQPHFFHLQFNCLQIFLCSFQKNWVFLKSCCSQVVNYAVGHEEETSLKRKVSTDRRQSIKCCW